MTLRVEVSGTQRITYTQAFDIESRLTAVTNTVSGAVTRFWYDGDGNRIRRVENGITTTIYIGAHFEKNVTTGVATTYYDLGSQWIALRQGSTLYYLHADHLGSASLATNASGQEVNGSRTGYLPFGGVRYGGNGLPTDRRYTGQRADYYIKLYHMGARMYDPELGRFISPDSIVPDFSNPQSLNRYAYVVNNPIKYRDPTGHWFETALDIAGIIWDIHDIKSEGLNFWTGAALTVDVVCLIVPVATGGGAAVRAVSHADDVVRVVARTDDLVDAARTIDRTTDAAQVLARGSDAAQKIAFGLSQHPLHGMKGLLGNFAQHVKAITYWDIYDDTTDMKKMGERLLDMMQNADEIHFNLDGMTEFGTLEDAMRWGAEGIGQGNVTNWELHQVVQNFLDKTTFYLNGKVYKGFLP